MDPGAFGSSMKMRVDCAHTLSYCISIYVIWDARLRGTCKTGSAARWTRAMYMRNGSG
mgnify:FL=1